MEQELGLAAYFVSNEIPLEKGVRSEALESDTEKLSSTDNEDEELVTEGRPRLLISGVACAHLDSCTPFCTALARAPGESYPDMSLEEMETLSFSSDFVFPPSFGWCKEMEILK